MCSGELSTDAAKFWDVNHREIPKFSFRYSGVYMLVIFGGQQYMANRPRYVLMELDLWE